ncbi:MAG: hypothetical protein Q9220_007387 [cf. Caloplaca sp. 1 TL-2023]
MAQAFRLMVGKVSFGNDTYPATQSFLRATASQGAPTTDDLQDLVTGHGVEHWLECLNTLSATFIDRRTHKDLFLIYITMVDKVNIQRRQSGCRAKRPDEATSSPVQQWQQQMMICACKQIVLSCGTLSNPLVRQESRVGDPEKLRDVGIEPVVDLLGLGLDFQDHNITLSTYGDKSDPESFDDFFRSEPEVQRKVF